jgi:hypothetical protein
MACLPYSLITKSSMTFQVGAARSDGIILGSDRKLTNISGYRHGRMSPKIEVYESDGFAHCSAGDGFCESFTNVVHAEIKAGRDFTDLTKNTLLDVRQALVDAVIAARSKEKEYRAELQRGQAVTQLPVLMGGTTMLVFRGKGDMMLWRVDTLSATPNAAWVDIGEITIAGDTNSPAVFFPEHYFHKLPNTVTASIPLVAHTVLMAKGDFVDGLAIGVFTPKIFKVLSESELKPFIEFSKQLDLDLESKFGSLVVPTSSE